MPLLQGTLHSSRLLCVCLPVLNFLGKLQSLNSLIKLKSASHITAQAGERPIAFSLLKRRRTGTHAFFRCYSVVTDILQDHGQALVFVLLSEKQLNAIQQPSGG